MLSKLNRPFPAPGARASGWRQELECSRKRRRRGDIDVSDEEPKPCYGVNSFLREWSEGKISAPTVRRHCVELMKDGATWPAVRRIASLGGCSEKHVHDALLTLLERDCGLADHISKVPLPLVVTDMVLPCTFSN